MDADSLRTDPGSFSFWRYVTQICEKRYELFLVLRRRGHERQSDTISSSNLVGDNFPRRHIKKKFFVVCEFGESPNPTVNFDFSEGRVPLGMFSPQRVLCAHRMYNF